MESRNWHVLCYRKSTNVPDNTIFMMECDYTQKTWSYAETWKTQSPSSRLRRSKRVSYYFQYFAVKKLIFFSCFFPLVHKNAKEGKKIVQRNLTWCIGRGAKATRPNLIWFEIGVLVRKSTLSLPLSIFPLYDIHIYTYRYSTWAEGVENQIVQLPLCMYHGY